MMASNPQAAPMIPPVANERSRILRVLAGESLEVPPVWLMRQAGRYLAEYRALRAEKGGFLDLVTDPEAATEVTLQPIRRFGFDAAILFSDILIVPWAMGQDLAFLVGEGPQLSPPLASAAFESLVPRPERAAPVFETVARVRASLDPSRALIGFAGSPWTVATYAVAGEGSRDQEAARLMAWMDEARFAGLIDAIVEATASYLLAQVRAGADVLMLFDSWSGSLAPGQFERWVIAPTARLVEMIRARHAELPIIGFPRGAGTRIPAYVRETRVTAVGLDETVDPVWANATLPEGLPVQGNLDPLAVIAGGPVLEAEVRRIVAAFRGRPHIFNLGHGIRQETPVAHVETLLATLRNG
jgi:uroporphyrinogen decarboxylase